MGTEEGGCSRRIGSAWMLLDRNGENARRYNALWLPRAYALDQQGRVTYVQPETTLDPQAPLQVAAIWSGGRPVAQAGDASNAPPLPGPLSPAVLLANSGGARFRVLPQPVASWPAQPSGSARYLHLPRPVRATRPAAKGGKQ